MKGFFHILIVTAAVLGICGAAEATEIGNFSFDNSTQTIQISGSCSGYSVVIRISAVSSAEPLYTAGGECNNSQFVFEDNLGYWGLPAGEYRLVAYDANSPLSNPSEEKIFTIENLPEQYLPDDPSGEPATSTDEEPAEDEPNDHFFIRFIEILLGWLKNAVLAIKELTVDKITASSLCVGETCVNEDDFEKLIKSKNKPDNNKPEDNKPEEDIKPDEDDKPEDNKPEENNKSEAEEQTNFTEPQENSETKNEEGPPPNIISGGEDVFPSNWENKHDILPASDKVDALSVPTN